MAASRAASRNHVGASVPAPFSWPQQFLLYALFFAGLMLLHASLLRLPYFWDEAGYYIPAARDLLLTHSLIPHSTVSNAHPPLVLAWLALAWRVFGYSIVVTRTAILAIAAFALLGLLRICRLVAAPAVAWTAVLLTAIYPVFFMQSSLAHVDMAAAALTFWALAAYLEDRPWAMLLWLSLAVLAKETAVLAPLTLFGVELLAAFIRLQETTRWDRYLPAAGRRIAWLHPLLALVPLAAWYAFHYAKTGYLLGNPEFVRYNVAATVSPLRIPLALGLRLWQLFGYFGLYLLTVAGALAVLQPVRANAPKVLDEKRDPSVRPLWMHSVLIAVIVAYLLFMSVIGGAVLARYMLPVVPLVVLLIVTTLSRRIRYWKLMAAAVAIAFVAGLFTNPPYGFAMEDNFAYRDYAVMHLEASRFLAMHYPDARVLTAWPASDELTRPWLGYTAHTFRVFRIEDFSPPQIDLAVKGRDQYDILVAFSTKYQPAHPLLENWQAWTRVKEKFFGYHRDEGPEDIAARVGGSIVFHDARDGQWVAVIARTR